MIVDLKGFCSSKELSAKNLIGDPNTNIMQSIFSWGNICLGDPLREGRESCVK